MKGLFREQLKKDKIREIEAKIIEEKALREHFLTVERANELQDINTINDVYAEKKKQSQISAEVKRKEMIKQQKILDKELAEIIEKKKKEATRQESLRLQLKNSSELRELERKLLIARVAKEQSIQKANFIAAEQLRKQEEKELAKKLAEEIKKEERASQLKEQQKKAVQKQYHEALNKQIAQQSMVDTENEKEVLKERQLIDSIVEKLFEEDIEMARKKIEERNHYCKQIEEFRRVKKEMEDLEVQQHMEEETRAADFRLAQNYRTQEQEERRKAEFEVKLQRQSVLLKKLEKSMHEKACEENLRIELAMQEKDLKDEGRDQMYTEKKLRLQAEASEMYSMQMWLRNQREELERKEEELFTKSMLEKLYREEKLAFLSDCKKKEKQREHRKIIQNMIEERRKTMLAEKEQEMADFEFQKELSKEKEKLIEKERQRILVENAGDLLGFLPKGVLQDYEEVNELGDAFKQFYAKKPNADGDLS